MGLIEVASGNSVWRGMDYYKNKRVKSWQDAGEGIYDGIVSGSGDNEYVVHIDKNHPRKSTCNCPFADGRRVVCKHMIALDVYKRQYLVYNRKRQYGRLFISPIKVHKTGTRPKVLSRHWFKAFAKTAFERQTYIYSYRTRAEFI